MSDSAANFSFPNRTPVFTTVLVLVCFAVLGWVAKKVYFSHPDEAAPIEGVRSPADRKELLTEHQAKEKEALTTYGWIDQKGGVVRLPIDRAIELTAHDLGKK